MRAALLFAIAAMAAGTPRPVAGAIEEIWHRRLDSPTGPSRIQLYSTPPRTLVDGSLLVVGLCSSDTCFVRLAEGGQVLSRAIRRQPLSPHFTDPWGGVFFVSGQGVEKIDAYSGRRLFLREGLSGSGSLTPANDLVVNDPQQGLVLVSGVDGRTLWTGLAVERPPETSLIAATETTVFLAGSDGTVFGYRLSDGVRTLSARHAGPSRNPKALAAEGDRCFLAALEGLPNPIAKVYAFHATNGLDWVSPSLGPSVSSRRHLLALNRSGHLFLAKSTVLYQNRLAELSQISLADGSIVFGPSLVGPPPPSPPRYTEEDVEALAVDDEGDALVSTSRFASAGLVRRFSHTTGASLWPFPISPSPIGSAYSWLLAHRPARGVLRLVGLLRGSADLVHLELSGATGTPLGRPTIVEGIAELEETASAVVVEPGGGLCAVRHATGRTVLDRFDPATGERTSRTTAPWIPYGSGLRVGPEGELVFAGADLHASLLTRLLPDGRVSWQKPIAGDASLDLQVVPATGDVYVFTETTYRRFDAATGETTPVALPFPLAATRSLARVHAGGDVIVVSELPPVADPMWVVTRYGPDWSPIWTTNPMPGKVVRVGLEGTALSLLGTSHEQTFLVRLHAESGRTFWGPQAPPGYPSSFELPVLRWLPNGEVIGIGRVPDPMLGQAPMVFRLRADGTEAWRSPPVPLFVSTLSSLRIEMISGDPVVLVPASPALPQALRLDGVTGSFSGSPVSLPFEPAGDRIIAAGERAFALLGQDELFLYGDLPTARPQSGPLESTTCGEAFLLQLEVRNLANATWTVVQGTLPPGLVLRPDGLIEGNPAAGSHAFRLRATGSDGAVDREYTLEVGDLRPAAGIEASPSESSCAGSPVTLRAPEGYAAYAWTPGGETSRAITVSPRSGTAYGVVMTNADGCVSRALRTVEVTGRALSIQAPTTVPADGEFDARVDGTGLSQIVWTVVNGSLVAGQGMRAVRIRAGGDGVVSVSVAASAGGCEALDSVAGVLVQEKLGFYTVEPCRLLDTRESLALWDAYPTRDVPAAGRCGIPADARVLVVNLTALPGPGAWGLWLTPAGVESALSYSSLASVIPSSTNVRTVPLMVALPADGSGTLQIRLSGPGPGNAIVDVSGYFKPVPPSGRGDAAPE